MTKLTQHFITGALVLLVFLMISLNYYQQKSRKKEKALIINELEFLLDSTAKQLQQSEQQRFDLLRSFDSLHRSDEALSLLIKRKDLEIKRLRGIYDHIDQDSLGKLMDSRANQ